MEGVKKVKDVYEEIYTYENTLEEEEEYYKKIANLLPNDAKNILDIGCGRGLLLSEIENKYEIYGLDISQSAAKFTKKAIPDSHIVRSNGSKLPFKDSCFESIACLGSLEHFPDMDLALEEMKRVAKRGGTLILTLPNKNSWRKNLIAKLCIKLRNLFFNYILEGNLTDLVKRIKNEGPPYQPIDRQFNLKKWKEIIRGSGLRIARVLPCNTYKLISRFFDNKLENSYHFTFILQNNKEGK